MHIEKFFKKSLDSKRFYFRMLIPFVVLTVIIVVAATLIFSNLYINELYNQAVTDSTYNMERLTNNIDSIFSQLVYTCVSLSENKTVYSCLHDTSPDSLSVLQANKYLNYFTNTNTYIHSIILYNKNAEYPILAGKINIDPNQFLKKDLKRPDLDNSLYLVYCSLNPASRSDLSLETTSLIYSDSWNKNGTIDNGTIITLNKEVIERKLLGEFDGLSLIVDKSGKIAFSSYNYPGEKFITDEDYFSDIVNLGEIKGTFRAKVYGENKIITYAKSFQSDFYIINIKSYDDIIKPINDKRNLFMSICLLALCFLVILAYFISKFVYSPIKKVTELFRKAEFIHPESGLDEVSVISNVFKETQEYIKKLEDKSKYSNEMLKEDFLRKLIKSNEFTKSENIPFQDYQFNIGFDNLILASIRIDDYNKLYQSSRNVYVKTLCRIVPELLKEHFKCEIIDIFDGEIALMLNYVNPKKNDFSVLLQSMDTLRDTTRKTLGITLSIGIGGVANNINECSDAYSKAVEMVKHRFILGTDRTIYRQYIDENLIATNNYPSEMEDKIIKSIKSNIKDDFVRSLNDTFELLKNYPYAEAVSVFFQVTTSCIKTINQTTAKANSKFYLNFDELSSIFSSLETLDQAKKWLLNIFDEYQIMLEGIYQLKSSKHYAIIDSIQKNIRQNYMDINLSVESLSDSIEYTPYYFSRIFKEITGSNVLDYIRQIRIDKAKEFLCNDEYKINEIPAMVGFTSISHFYSVFKKEVGLTPAAYKDYMQDNKSIE